MTKKRRGNCYVTCEALYHLLGGKAAGYVPHTVRHEGAVHWFLRRRAWHDTGTPSGIFKKGWNYFDILDPTVSQFKTSPDYGGSRGRGFLTKGPSKRAREMMERMVWQ